MNERMEQAVETCRTYAAARLELETVADEIREAKRRIVRQKLPVLKRRIAAAQAAREELAAIIGDNPDLFEKPRTVAVDGVKFGYRKLPGALTIADKARTLALIRQKLPERADSLIRVTENVSSAALKTLSARELARIGVVLGRDTDEVTIRSATGELEKLIDALLDEGREDE